MLYYHNDIKAQRDFYVVYEQGFGNVVNPWRNAGKCIVCGKVGDVTQSGCVLPRLSWSMNMVNKVYGVGHS